MNVNLTLHMIEIHIFSWKLSLDSGKEMEWVDKIGILTAKEDVSESYGPTRSFILIHLFFDDVVQWGGWQII